MTALEPLDLGAVRADLAHPGTDHRVLADHVPALIVEIERLTIENRRLHARLNMVRGHLHLAVAALCAPTEEEPDGR